MTYEDSLAQAKTAIDAAATAAKAEITARDEKIATLEARVAELEEGSGEPDTGTPTAPVIGKVAFFGTASYPVSGTNVYRNVDQLVVYTAPTTVSPANQYGTEVSIVDNKVVAVNKRITTGDTRGTPVPQGGYLLSGHDDASDWLIANAAVGKTIEWDKSPVIVDPGGTTGAAPQPYPAKVVSLYHMMWTNSGSPRLSTLHGNFNDLRLAFAQGDPPGLVGPASEGSFPTLKAEVAKLRARGVRVLISIGGADGHVNLSNRQAFVNGIMNINNNQATLDGLDWDLEGVAMNTADVVWICQELKRLRGPNFAITMAPNGSNIGEYLTIGVELERQGLLSGFGQQFYDAEVSQGAMMGRIDEAVRKGIPVSKYHVGTMVGTTSKYWTVDACVANVRAARTKYPALAGAYLWEHGRAGTADWANRVGALVKA